MLDIDQFAYSNQLRSLHPGEKMLFAFATMLVCLLANSVFVSLTVILLMSGGVVFKAKIPGSFWGRLLLIPLSFLLIGSITSAVSVTKEPVDLIYYFSLGPIKVGIKLLNLMQAVNLFLRALGSISCLYFLALTTPMIEIIAVLNKLKVPNIFIELMRLIYRLIFIFLQLVDQIRISQLSRLGYSSWQNSLSSVSKLLSNLFIKAYYQAQELLTALKSRGYTGKIRVLERNYQFSRQNLLVITIIEVGLIILAIWLRGGLIGGGNF